MSQDILKPLDHLSYLVECAALNYMGELKTELADLCRRIKGAEAGYCSPAVAASLPDLEDALALFRGDTKLAGAGKLSAVSRKWWAAAGAP